MVTRYHPCHLPIDSLPLPTPLHTYFMNQRSVHRSQLYKPKKYRNTDVRHTLKELDTSKALGFVSCNTWTAALLRPEGPCNACVPSLWVARCYLSPRGHVCRVCLRPEQAGGLPSTLRHCRVSPRGATSAYLQAAGVHGYTEGGQVRDAEAFMNVL